jgi:hypothetical protein
MCAGLAGGSLNACQIPKSQFKIDHVAADAEVARDLSATGYWARLSIGRYQPTLWPLLRSSNGNDCRLNVIVR